MHGTITNVSSNRAHYLCQVSRFSLGKRDDTILIPISAGVIGKNEVYRVCCKEDGMEKKDRIDGLYKLLGSPNPGLWYRLAEIGPLEACELLHREENEGGRRCVGVRY